MINTVKIIEITQGGSRELGLLSEGEYSVGRDPSADIVMFSEAVSSFHGTFASFGSYWFYRDLGSTNGSWLNGERARPHEWMAVCPGDILQLADGAIKFFAQGNYHAVGLEHSSRALTVFSQGQYIGEFPVPDYGRAVTVGGNVKQNTPFVALEGDVYQDPACVVERLGTEVLVKVMGKHQVFVNGIAVHGEIELSDRDEIQVQQLRFIFIDETAQSSALQKTDSSPATQSFKSKSWEEEASVLPSSSIRSPFGQLGRGGTGSVEETEGTVSVKVAELQRMRAGEDPESVLRASRQRQNIFAFRWTSMEGILVLFTAACFALVVILLIVYLLVR